MAVKKHHQQLNDGMDSALSLLLALAMALAPAGIAAFPSAMCDTMDAAIKGPLSISQEAPALANSSAAAEETRASQPVSLDLAAFSGLQGGRWFQTSLTALPETHVSPLWEYKITGEALANRSNGKISGILAAKYIFIQSRITPQMIRKAASTVKALFIRSALMSFVDYQGNRVLNWDRRSSTIPTDVKAIIKEANRLGIPVFLELNYSDYIPGAPGSGMDKLKPADNISRTVQYLKGLDSAGLRLEGVTFGDEIGDASGFGEKKPTMMAEDIAQRFIRYARAIKEAFPDMEIFAFDSCISASSGEMYLYDKLLQEISEAEKSSATALLDGFIYRESYVYMNDQGKLLDSQKILDDTESLYRETPVWRYDSLGYAYENADRDYLHALLAKTAAITGRDLILGLSEYLPAGPVQINESDTSIYKDIDFILHYADVIGIYASLGLDFVSSWVFANSNDQAKCYYDIKGHAGKNFPVYHEIAGNLKGQMLLVRQDPGIESNRIRIHAYQNEGEMFIMILNKHVSEAQTIRLDISGKYDLSLKLPACSYTSLLIDRDTVMISGIAK